MTVTDELLENNERYVSGFGKGDLPLPPAKQVAVVACMDARLDPARALGLEEGDAHVIRNAGGAVTDDAIRSLVISQRLLVVDEEFSSHSRGLGYKAFAEELGVRRPRARVPNRASPTSGLGIGLRLPPTCLSRSSITSQTEPVARCILLLLERPRSYTD
jgi:hypothetical protein